MSVVVAGRRSRWDRLRRPADGGATDERQRSTGYGVRLQSMKDPSCRATV
jgi:hypothetical protein